MYVISKKNKRNYSVHLIVNDKLVKSSKLAVERIKGLQKSCNTFLKSYKSIWITLPFTGESDVKFWITFCLLRTNFTTMKSYYLAIALSFIAFASFGQEYKIITTVESIVPMGLGRSRMVDPQSSADYKPLTTERTDGKKSSQNDVKRDDIKIDNFEETKLLNFFSAVGINFQNIASNDAVVSSKLNDLAKEGWTLAFVTSGVESDAGDKDGNGIFITRYVFKRDKPVAAQSMN
jgi:hypothetical protein